MPRELVTRSFSAIILGTAVLYLTWLGTLSFAILCGVGSIILLKEWWGLTKHRSRWWLLIGLLYIGFGTLALIAIRSMGFEQILGLFAVVWGADIAGYLVGRTFGKHKIAPHISPGKSWEGLAASLIVCGAIGAYAMAASGEALIAPSSIITILVSASYALVGLLGDMFESSLKRHAGVKDSGKLIPGHGGLFDRVDALLACAVYSLLLYVLLMLVAIANNQFHI